MTAVGWRCAWHSTNPDDPWSEDRPAVRRLAAASACPALDFPHPHAYSPMPLGKIKCKAFWSQFPEPLAPEDPRSRARLDAVGFGGGGEFVGPLAALVVAGNKRATASLPEEYTPLDEALPKKGDLSIILNGAGDPVAIIERTHVDVVPFGQVGARFAARRRGGWKPLLLARGSPGVLCPGLREARWRAQ